MNSQDTSAGAIDPLQFDPRVPLVDPYPMYHAMRAHDPVLWHEPTRTWLVTSYEVARSVMRDDEIFGQRFEMREVARNGDAVREQPYFQIFRRMMFLTDGDDHRRLRPLFSKWFMGPGRMNMLTPIIQASVDRTLDRLEGRERFDLIRDFAYPVPLLVISELLGVPEEDAGMIARDIHHVVAIIESIQKSNEVKQKADAALIRLRDYFRTLTARRRGCPGDDLLSAMIADFDEGRFHDEDELLANVLLMYIAGHETTTDSIGLAILSLFRNRDEMERLRAEPSIARSAVEELIRYDGTAQGFSRAPNRDVRVGDKQVAANSFILLLLGAANRDPAAFADPDRLDLTRGSMRSVGFGGGAHACIGNMLARAELQIGLTSLLARQPRLELEAENPADVDFKPSLTRGLLRLDAVAN